MKYLILPVDDIKSIEIIPPKVKLKCNDNITLLLNNNFDFDMYMNLKKVCKFHNYLKNNNISYREAAKKLKKTTPAISALFSPYKISEELEKKIIKKFGNIFI